MSDSTVSYLLAGCVIILWATIGSAFKLTLKHLAPAELLLWALPVSIGATAAIITLQGRWAAVRATTRSDLARSALLGFLQPFLYYLILLKAYSLLLTQEATVLNMAWPLVLVLFSAVFLKQRLTVTTIAALLLGFIGIYVIATRGRLLSIRFSDPVGVSLALGSTLVWASFWVFNMRDRRDTAVKLFLNFCFALLFMLATWPFLSSPRVPPLAGLAGAVYVGLFEMGVTYFLWLTALSYARHTADVASLIFLTPFAALCCIAAVVGERILPSTVAGLVLIIAGILLQRRSAPALPVEND